MLCYCLGIIHGLKITSLNRAIPAFRFKNKNWHPIDKFFERFAKKGV